jgi:hypothetical protein
MYAEGSIESIQLLDQHGVPCQAFVMGAFRLRTSVATSFERAADGTPHINVATPGVKGKRFGLRLPFCHQDVFDQVIAAIEAKVSNAENFTVDLEDDNHHYLITASVDGEDWMEHADQVRTNEHYIADVVFKFLAVAVVEI